MSVSRHQNHENDHSENVDSASVFSEVALNYTDLGSIPVKASGRD